MDTSRNFLCIKTASAPKTGLNAKGVINYAVLRDTEGTDVYVCLMSNDAGGYFSQEAVSARSVERCLKGFANGDVIPAKVFQSAFKGRSANNGGFLAAVLRNEQLLSPNPDAPHQHLLGIGLEEWREAMRQAPAEPFELPSRKKEKPVADTITNAAEELPMEHNKSKKSRKNPTGKRELPSADQDGGGNDCSA